MSGSKLCLGAPRWTRYFGGCMGFVSMVSWVNPVTFWPWRRLKLKLAPEVCPSSPLSLDGLCPPELRLLEALVPLFSSFFLLTTTGSLWPCMLTKSTSRVCCWSPEGKFPYLLVSLDWSRLPWSNWALCFFVERAFRASWPKPAAVFMGTLDSKLFLRTIGSTDLLVLRGLSLGGCLFFGDASLLRVVLANRYLS